MKISVITPTWNRASSLEETLRSVERQTPLPLEHLVLDNESTDDTAQVVEAYRDRARHDVIHLREPDNGMYQAMNRGLRRARGDALYILNDDDQFNDPEALHALATCLDTAHADLAYGDTVWVDPREKSLKPRRHNQINKLTLVHKAINQQAILYRNTVFQQCGLFDESFRIAGDYEWILRAFFAEHISAAYLKRPIARCALGGLSNNSEVAQRCRREREEVTRRWFTPREVELSNLYRKYIRKIPLGTKAMNLFVPLRLDIQTFRWRQGRPRPDFWAHLDF